MRRITRRKFLRDVALTGATLTLPNFVSSHAFTTPTPTLTLDLYIWPSMTETYLPWKTQNPRYLATKFSHMLWTHIRASGNRWAGLAGISSRKTSLIGHAALVATMTHGNGKKEPKEIFSHTGDLPGVYHFAKSRFPSRYRMKGIMGCFYVGEVLAYHTSEGLWETHSRYEDRMRKNRDFRHWRYTFEGDQARNKYALLKAIKRQTERVKASAIGAPRHYGLNRTSVRLIGDSNRSMRMSRYSIGGSKYEFHGGCANAVASVLEAVELGDLVPSEAEFTIRLDLQRFQNIPLPVITRRRGFFKDGRPRDNDLIDELNKIPLSWGSGDIVSFVDPNYWYRRLLQA